MKTLRAIKAAVRQQKLSPGSNFSLNPNDAFDLQKIKFEDLVADGFDQSVAKDIVSESSQGNHTRLGKYCGVTFVMNDNAPSVVNN